LGTSNLISITPDATIVFGVELFLTNLLLKFFDLPDIL
jgi:hypothetical protein